MNKILLVISGILIVTGCKEGKSNTQHNSINESVYRNSDQNESDIWNGSYCAEIEYYNPNTDNYSNYTLIIDVNENDLEQINFPNGGYLDDFYSVEFDDDGYTKFTSDKGYDYEVQIVGDSANCFENVPMAVQCIGITENSEQCENLTDTASGYCWQHENQE